MKAGKTVQTILNLAGFKNIKSKVINYQTESKDYIMISWYSLWQQKLLAGCWLKESSQHC